MAKKFLTGLRLVNLPSDPSAGSEGEIYFNTSSSAAKIYKSGEWTDLDTFGGGSISQEQIQDYVAPLFTNATNTNVVATYDDANNVINLNTSGSLISVDSIVYPDYITFDITPEIEPADPGSLWWSTDFETLNLQLDAGVDLQIGQEHLVRVKNNSGSVAIPKGTAVMFAGAAGDTVKASPAVSTIDSDPELLIGITAEIIPADGFGFVTQFGFINTTDTETPGWSLGNLLYVDPVNPGQLTNVKPSPPNWTFPIAAVTKINSNSGRILVRAIPGKHLHDIVDVSINSELNNQALVYNSSASVWNNENIVNSLTGTTNEINISASVGNITIGIPDSPVFVTPNIGAATASSLIVGDATIKTTTTVMTSASATTIATFPAGSALSAECLVVFSSENSGAQTTSKVLIAGDDGNGTVDITEYAIIQRDGGFGIINSTISASLSGGNILLRATVSNYEAVTAKVVSTHILSPIGSS